MNRTSGPIRALSPMLTQWLAAISDPSLMNTLLPMVRVPPCSQFRLTFPRVRKRSPMVMQPSLVTRSLPSMRRCLPCPSTDRIEIQPRVSCIIFFRIFIRSSLCTRNHLLDAGVARGTAHLHEGAVPGIKNVLGVRAVVGHPPVAAIVEIKQFVSSADRPIPGRAHRGAAAAPTAVTADRWAVDIHHAADASHADPDAALALKHARAIGRLGDQAVGAAARAWRDTAVDLGVLLDIHAAIRLDLPSLNLPARVDVLVAVGADPRRILHVPA